MTKYNVIRNAKQYSIRIIYIVCFHSGTHGLNEELDRHRGREGSVYICNLCGEDCEVWVTFCGIALFIQSAVHYF